MIQRIQSIYLLAAALLLSALFFTPTTAIDIFLGDQSRTIEILPFGIAESAGESIGSPYYGILTALAVALSIAVILMFKNRPLQMRLVAADIVLQTGIIVFIAYYIYKSYALADSFEGMEAMGASVYVSLSPVCAAPIAAVIFSCLAFRGIVRDHILVKSLDRIR